MKREEKREMRGPGAFRSVEPREKPKVREVEREHVFPEQKRKERKPGTKR